MMPKKAAPMETETREELKVGGTTYFKGKYEKPMRCPYCGVYTDTEQTNAGYFILNDERQAVVISNRCTRCKSSFLAVYIIKGGCISLNTIIPITDNDAVHEGLKTVSPDFERIHQQAYRAEVRGDLDIAAIGYRTALEMLIKDFAKQELNAPAEDVDKMSLATAISTYSNSKEFENPSNVVRILGNDFTHYQKKHEEHGFDELKHYYGIVLRMFGIRYDMRHPPVG